MMAVESPRPVRDAGYYLNEASLTLPKFEGNLAKLLGIEGQPVDRATFLNLFNGYTTDENGNPDNRLPKYMHPERRGAFDITLNLPKTASIVKEIGDDTRISDVMT